MIKDIRKWGSVWLQPLYFHIRVWMVIFFFLSALSSLTGCPSCVNSIVCVPLIGVCPFIWLIDRSWLHSGKCYSFAQSFSVNDSPNGQMQKIYFKLTFKYKEDLVLLKAFLCIEGDWMKHLSVTFKRDKSDFFTPAVQHFDFQSVWVLKDQSAILWRERDSSYGQALAVTKNRKRLWTCKQWQPRRGCCNVCGFIRAGQHFHIKRRAKNSKKGFFPLLTGFDRSSVKGALRLPTRRWHVLRFVDRTNRKPFTDTNSLSVYWRIRLTCLNVTDSSKPV